LLGRGAGIFRIDHHRVALLPAPDADAGAAGEAAHEPAPLEIRAEARAVLDLPVDVARAFFGVASILEAEDVAELEGMGEVEAHAPEAEGGGGRAVRGGLERGRRSRHE